ncbi:MAG: hypothetical protein Ta2G_16850 [Termitinemataceae bacterium]|nr:MAG: hypothetical protein Ta2G_16850 [Termitinemataceae bacterium]
MSNSYDESNTRSDFIDRFFEEVLDWDVRNKEGASEVYRDVVREDKVKINGQTKAPDYAFRFGGIVKFYVEAKKPSVNIKDNPEPAYQVRRYAWTKKLPVSILTNMREFAVYDTRVKPAENDKASEARIFYRTFKEYEQHLEFFYNTFSKQGIRNGSFDKYTEEEKSKKGTSEVDRELLNLVEEWRMELAKNIALRNTAISIYNLNTVVQKIIDRIVFLRIAEDKGIEDADLLKTIAPCKDVYTHLNQLFVNANNKYNAGLFKTEEWIEKVQIDDAVLRNIIVNLYYPKSPYEFSVLPIEILGNIYEKFLGKTITFRGVKGGHTAVIEEKPEVKKAGGVYYTPQYIVDYIVQNTVGALIKDKTPDEIAALRFVDPACGSGSFLVGAYQYLLNYHLDYYTDGANVKSALKKEKIYEASHGAYKLTIAEKQKILQNNIYGIDIDSQAVEVTKLSLYLKLLENEGKEAEGQLFKFTDMKLLPSLENNIKCGNSLIGTDFYAQGELALSEEEQFKVNCFDWEKEFSDIFKNGGFDAVIGNPPYGAGLTMPQKKYLNNRFPVVSDFETAQYFIIKSFDLLKQDGYNSFIIPNTMFINLFAKQFRSFIYNNFNIIRIADLSNIDVFVDATVRTVIYALKKSNKKSKISFENYNSQFELTKKIKIAQTEIKNWETWDFNSYELKPLIDKIRKNTLQLNEIFEVCQGLIPYDKYRGHDEYTIKNRIWHADFKKDKTYKKELRGADVTRYALNWNGENWISYGDWLAAPRKPEYFRNPRILFREITDGVINATFTDDEYYNNPSIINCISRFENEYALFFILGIVNSKLIAKYHMITSPKANKGVFPKILVNDVRKLPIPALDLSKPTDKTAHDTLVALVDKMLDLKRREHDEPNPQAKTVLQRQIGAVDGQIDTAVYDLYKLTEEEITIIEGN